MLLQYESVKDFFQPDFKCPVTSQQALVEQMKNLLRTLPFTGVYSDDISSNIPFYTHLPSPDPTFRDTAKNVLFMITFPNISLYTKEDLVTFCFEFPLPCDITDVRRPLRKRFLTMEFLDNGSHSKDVCSWTMKFVYYGELFDTIHPNARKSTNTLDSPWWIFTCSLRDPNTNEEDNSIWLPEEISSEGLWLVFRAKRSELEEVSSIAFSSIHID